VGTAVARAAATFMKQVENEASRSSAFFTSQLGECQVLVRDATVAVRGALEAAAASAIGAIMARV
jgi:hypothetical protein